MSLSFPDSAQFGFLVGRTPWSAADALVGLVGLRLIALAQSGSRGTRADQGVRPTITARVPVSGKLSPLYNAGARFVQTARSI
jgi:hypothetical protein